MAKKWTDGFCHRGEQKHTAPGQENNTHRTLRGPSIFSEAPQRPLTNTCIGALEVPIKQSAPHEPLSYI